MSDLPVTNVHRAEPPLVATERTALEAWLDYHRATLLTKCEGLDAAGLKRAAAQPSNLTLLGLVRHLAEVERWWFREVLAGEDLDELFDTDDESDCCFTKVADADADADLRLFRDEVEAARAAAAAVTDLDATGTRTLSHGPRDLRWIYLHMIEEYARHNGHADLLRERIDGVTGD